MGIFSFLFGTLIGKIASAIVGIVVLAIAFVVVVIVLAAAGGPGACSPGGGVIMVDGANAARFQEKWDSFNGILDGGSPSSVSFNESEITSRFDQFVKEYSDDVKDIRVCIHEGFGEVTGTLDAFLGIDAKFRGTGNARFDGPHPDVEFTDIDIGNVPGWLLRPFEGLLEDAVEELMEEIDLTHSYTPTLAEGQAQVAGVPKSTKEPTELID